MDKTELLIQMIKNGTLTHEVSVSPNDIEDLLTLLADDYAPSTTMKYVCNADASSIMQIFERLDAEAFIKLFIENTSEEGYLNQNYNLFADGRPPTPTSDHSIELGSFDITVETDAETGDRTIVVGNRWGVRYSTITLIIYGTNAEE